MTVVFVSLYFINIVEGLRTRVKTSNSESTLFSLKEPSKKWLLYYLDGRVHRTVDDTPGSLCKKRRDVSIRLVKMVY